MKILIQDPRSNGQELAKNHDQQLSIVLIGNVMLCSTLLFFFFCFHFIRFYSHYKNHLRLTVRINLPNMLVANGNGKSLWDGIVTVTEDLQYFYNADIFYNT